MSDRSIALRLLAFIQNAAFRKESVIRQRFPTAEKALAVLKRDGFCEYHDNAGTCVHVTMSGRAELRRLRAAAERRAA